MRKLLFFTLMLCSLSVFGQELDFDQVVPTGKSRNFEDFLVQLAWLNTPSNRLPEYEKDIALLEAKRAKAAYWNIVRPNIGINPGGGKSNPILDSAGNISGFLLIPRFTVGVGVSLEPLFSTPKEVKIAKTRALIAEANTNQVKLDIRSEVLQRYQNYLLSIEILKARQNAEEDAVSNKVFISKLFENGEIDFEDFSQANTSYFSAVEARIQAESDIETAKILLEAIIGIPWEEAERYKIRRGF